MKVVICLHLVLALAFASNAFAETNGELAQQSVARCDATATEKPTPQMILAKVDAACALISKEGESSFARFQGKDSDFIFAGTYLWIHSPESGKMLMHPIKYKMIGKNVNGLRDGNGKYFFVEMNKTCLIKGNGWVEYTWPKPGEKDSSQKVSYVQMTTFAGRKYIVGCGVYDMNYEDVRVALRK